MATLTSYLSLWFLLVLPSPLASARCFNSSEYIPAIYVFGDSLLDSGNNNHISTKSKANFPPYGIDFDHNIPSGRFTNGKTVADYIAIHLGLPFVPPYLGLSEHQINKIKTGINYASAGSGILLDTNKQSSLPFDKQTELFHKTVKNNLPKALKTKARVEWHLSESLFVINTGVNDYSQNQNRAFHAPDTFALHLLQEFSIHLRRLYNIGARKFFVNNIPPYGCFPNNAYNTTPRGECNMQMNRVVTSYNRRLPSLLHQLESQLPGFVYVHSNLYKFLLETRASAKRYGIMETWKPCCPNSMYGHLNCYPNAVPCEDRDTHLFFDVHPSQIVNQIYARRCFNESTICTPLSLKQLSEC